MPDDLVHSLLWILEYIDTTTHDLASQHSIITGSSPPSPHSKISPGRSLIVAGAKRKFSSSENDHNGIYRTSTAPQLSGPQKLEVGISNLSNYQRKRMSVGELPPLPPIPNFWQFGSSPIKPRVLMQPLPSMYVLPLPLLDNNSRGPALSIPPMLPGSAAQTTQFQTFQYQNSVQSLPPRALQHEHGNILLELSRSQARVEFLDRKSQASEVEISKLTEEQSRLKAQIEARETQYLELQESRAEANQQSVSTRVQYMRIMAMSSKLQARGASDMQNWKMERAKWGHERLSFIETIAALELEKKTFSCKPSGSTLPNTIDALEWTGHTDAQIQSNTALISSGRPQGESEILRETYRVMKAALHGLQSDNLHFCEAIEQLGSISNDIQKHLQTAEEHLRDTSIEGED